MKTFCHIFFFICAPAGLFANYCWIQRADIGLQNRYAAMGFSINGKGYVGCGYLNGTALSDFWEYDPISNTWTQKANKPGTAVWAGADFTLNGKGYMIAGFTGSSYPTATYEYDPVGNTWTSKAPLPGARQDCHGFALGNYGYVVGGYSGSYYNTLYRFDPIANTWTTKAPFPGPNRDGIRGFEINNIGYVVGGFTGSSSQSSMYAYDPVTDSWSAKASYPGSARHSLCAFEMNGHGFAGAGRGNGSNVFYNDFAEYDPATNTWSMITPFPGTPLSYPVCFTIGNNGYISTGKYNSSVNSHQTWMLGYSPSSAFTYNSTACNLTVTFTNTSTPGAVYTWNFGDGSTSSQNSPTHTYTSSGNYYVTLITSNGSCTDTTSQLINVNSVNLTSSYTLVTDCSNQVFINGFTTNATSILWNWGDGSSTNGPAVSHGYNSPGTYLITLILSNGSCTDTTTQIVIIPPQVIAQFSFSINCSLGVSFNNLSSGGSSFIWDFGDGASSNQMHPTHAYATPGNYMVTLITSNGSCADTVFQNINVTSAGLTSSYSLSPNCNSQVLVVNFTTNASGVFWDWGDGTSASGPVTSHTYSSPGSYTVTLILTSGSCSDTTTESIFIPTPVGAQFSFTTDCSLGVSFSSQSSGVNNYSWNFGDGSNSGQMNPIHNYALPGIYQVQLTVSSGVCTDSLTLNVPVVATPPSVIVSNFSTCHDTIYLTCPSTAQNYQWQFGDGQSGSGQSLIHTYSNTGNYTVTLITSNLNCSDTSQVTFTIPAPLNATFNSNIDCNGSLNVSAFNQNGLSFNWDFGDGSGGSGVSETHQYATPGEYQVTLTVNNGYCTATNTHSISFESHIIPVLTSYLDSCTRTAFLQIQNDSSSTVNWYLGDGATATGNTVSHSYAVSALYQVIAIVNPGSICSDSLTINLDFSLAGDDYFFIPNVFTPNNDGFNDYFEIPGDGCSFGSIKIFNRWGMEVYSSSDRRFRWDGTFQNEAAPEGTYIYILKSGHKTYSGAIMLLR